MKKFLSVALVLSLALSLAACKSGSKYKKADKKMINAAENCFDAAEMTTKQKRNAIKKNLRVADTTFGDGAYLRLTSDDLEEMDYGEDKFNSDEIKVSNMTMFAKVDGDVDQVYATIAEMKNEEFAQDLTTIITNCRISTRSRRRSDRPMKRRSDITMTKMTDLRILFRWKDMLTQGICI